MDREDLEKSKSVREMTDAEQVEELRRTQTENAALKLRLQKKRELLSELKTDTDELEFRAGKMVSKTALA
jgi:hypothetical protein